MMNVGKHVKGWSIGEKSNNTESAIELMMEDNTKHLGETDTNKT